MDQLMELLPFLIPLFLVQLALMIAAVVHILRHNTYRIGNRVMWLVICLLVNIIGPILYFAIGRGDE
ncbi:MAG: PLD nuclease N-terminal domain-containing protein [Oscillospiraceae bacterium]|nr:PLD nuclease N-terminal domain-containing protein [Oscillospiraceae bacterium]